MKKFTNEQFDEFVRNQLYNYEQEPPAEVFHSLKKNISSSNGLQLWHVLSATIGGIILITAVYYFIANHHEANINQPITNYNTLQYLPTNETTTTPSTSNAFTESSLQITPMNKKINNNISHHAENTNISEYKPNTTEKDASVSQFEQITAQVRNEKPIYEVITKASTCKQWNGKASIRCNQPDINFYWKELNVNKSIVENIKYGQYTVFAKRGDEIIDTLIVNIPDSGSVKADFKLYDMLIGNDVVTMSENLSLVERRPWKQQKNVSFIWYFGDEAVYNQPEPQHSFSKSGQYAISLVVKSSHGCKDSITKSYIVEIPTNYVEMPNIFSPNGDGIHDYFSPVLYDMESVECTIFDRSGTLIYEWKGLDGRWDGKIRNTNQLAPPATYYYILKGTTKSGKQIMHKGMVQLVL